MTEENKIKSQWVYVIMIFFLTIMFETIWLLNLFKKVQSLYEQIKKNVVINPNSYKSTRQVKKNDKKHWLV